MKLECANGKEYENPNSETVLQVLHSLNNDDNDFVIFHSSGGFLQTAVSGLGGFILEYSDSAGYFRCNDEAIPAEKIRETFLSYLNNDNSWKGQFSWTKEDAGTTETTGTSRSGSSRQNPENLVDDLIDSVKKNIKDAAKKKLGKFLKF